MKIIRKQDYKINEWTGGITREICISPETAGLGARNFDIRISSAVINLTESDFSDFSGYTRYIMPIDGDITLFIRNEEIRLEKDKPFKFRGSDKVSSTNTKGATDFNVIFRESMNVAVQVCNNAKSEEAETATIVFALEDVKINDKTVEKHDTAILSEPFSVSGKAVIISIGDKMNLR